MLEIPSDGGFDNSRPDTIGVVAMLLLLIMLLLARVSNGGGVSSFQFNFESQDEPNTVCFCLFLDSISNFQI
jgi:hypothetical protein